MIIVVCALAGASKTEVKNACHETGLECPEVTKSGGRLSISELLGNVDEYKLGCWQRGKRGEGGGGEKLQRGIGWVGS